MRQCAQVFPDVPASEGAANVLRRARQLSELRWTPIRPVPAGISKGDAGRTFCDIFLPAWCPQVGAGYSAARYSEKYVGFNVSLETYMTALANPDSVMYTRSLHGRMPLCSAFYGTVCSQFVSYTLDFPFQIDCSQWPTIDGMVKVDPTPLENLALCDTLLTPRHVAIITGISRDAGGNIVDITVTESTLPTVKVTTFTPAEFKGYWLGTGYEVYRYTRLDKVTYTPDPWIHLEGDPDLPAPSVNPVLMPDYGNKANYLLGEEVTICVFDGACTAVEVSCGGAVEKFPVTEGKVKLTPTQVGFYQAVAVGDGLRSQPAEFCVVDAGAATDKEQYAPQEEIGVSFRCAAEDELVGWVVKTAQFAKFWCYVADDSGVIPVSAKLPAGDYLILAMYRNDYGVYSGHPHPIKVAE